jgi:hypothetical protein
MDVCRRTFTQPVCIPRQRSVLRAPPSCERCPMALMPRAGRAKGGEAMTARGLFISKAIAGYRYVAERSHKGRRELLWSNYF